GAFDVAARALHPFHPDPPRTVRRVQVVHPATGAPVDDALAACFRAPRSYTGEDLVELSTHGGLLVPAAAVAALVAAGARPARPGEFTRRAVLNGKLDLLQAEATADLIDAGSPAQHRQALRQLDRGLSGRLEQLRAELLELEALIAYDIDFPAEDEGPVSPARVAAELILFCRDAGCEGGDPESARFLTACRAPVVEVVTKIDLVTRPSDRLAVSVMTGEGLDTLRARLAEAAFGRLLALGDVEPVI